LLGIETSCDETAAAIVSGGRILSNVVSSSVEFHKRFGGVVPEIASRKQIELISPVIQDALREAGLGIEDIEAVAVTVGPGLIGSLVVGVAAAKAIAVSRGIPLIGVNHLEGHIYANFLLQAEGENGRGGIPFVRRLADQGRLRGVYPEPKSEILRFAQNDRRRRAQNDRGRRGQNDSVEVGWQEPVLPAIALIVSGGHSNLVLVHDHGRYETLGRTRDDAAGEAFDKAARLLGLGFPGGPAIEAASEGGDPGAIAFPRAKLGRSLDFSFSGVKTALARYLDATPEPDRPPVRDIAASFQRAIVEPLAHKAVQAALDSDCRTLLVCGGVAANRALRALLARAAGECDLDLRIPPVALCTDNAAMIARVGEQRLRAGLSDALDIDAAASFELASWA
jgi:N6-L-threonylcarbamoyladenine synthase